MIAFLALGGAMGAATAALIATRRLPKRDIPLAVALSVAAGIYIGFGLADGRLGQAALQVSGALPFLLIATRWPHAISVLGWAWIAHAGWDAGHELGLFDTRVPSWYPSVCLGLDVVLGAAAVRWGRHQERVLP